MHKNSVVEHPKQLKMALDEHQIAPGEHQIAPGEHLESIKKQPQVTRKGERGERGEGIFDS